LTRFRLAQTLVSATLVAAVCAGAAAGAPTSSIRPALTGTFAVGKQLTGDAGTWAGSGSLTYAYQWYRCTAVGAKCKAVHGATAPAYTPGAADVGTTLGLTVRATDSSGAGESYSSLAGPIASGTVYATTAPKISGDASVGGKLTADAGTWGTTPQSLAYQWLRCNPNGRLCVPIAAATTAAYTPVSADVAHALVAQVTAKVGTTAQAALSAATAAVTAHSDALPTGATALGGGRYSVPVESVALPARLVVAKVATANGTLTVSIEDSRGYAIRGAFVLVTAPYGWVAQLGESATGNDGTVALQLRPKAGHPRRVVLYVRARKPGDDVLKGVTGTRLVSVVVPSA
jgi:hypothetical protein